MNLDRFAEGELDIQDMPVLGTCTYCGDSLYWYRDNMMLCDYCENHPEKWLEEETDEY